MVSVSVASSALTAGASQEQSPVPQTGQHSDSIGTYTDRREPTPSVTPAPERDRYDSQSEQHQTLPEEEEWLMACRCESGKMLVTLLSCLQHVADRPSDTQVNTSTSTNTQSSIRRQKKHKSIQPVTVFCTPSGFTFHVFGPAKQSEASCELQKSMFSEYQVVRDAENQEDWQAGGEFCVNLTSVLDSLQLLGPLDNRTSVGLSYNLISEIFKVELLQDGPQGVLCTSAIPGLMAPADDPDGDSLSSAFRSSPVAARIMVRSGILRELLPEWSNVAGASCASVAVSTKRGLELAVLGHYGECWVQVPAIGDHLVSPLELANNKKTVTRTYPLHSLLTSMQGLDIAEETCININTEGILAIQHKTVDPTGQGSHSFVDFIMTCLEDEDEQDRDEDENIATAADAWTHASASQSQFTRHSTSPIQVSASQTQLTCHANSQSSPHQSPDMATTKSRRRQRRIHKASPSQRTTASSDLAGQDVEQGSSDTEDDFGTPSERQKRQALMKQKQQESDSSSEEETQPVISAKPLFGAAAARGNDNKGVINKPSASPSRRRQRRSASRPIQKRAEEKDDADASDASKNLLASSENDEDESYEEEMRNVRTSASCHRDDCSSPELVYGKQM